VTPIQFAASVLVRRREIEEKDFFDQETKE